MKQKHIIFVVIVFALFVFGWLVALGWTRRYGPPSNFQPEASKTLHVKYRPRGLDLKTDGTAPEAWEDVASVDIRLLHQITEKPWPKELTAAVSVQACHDGENIYFRMEWEDGRASAAAGPGIFPDACAVALPLEEGPPPASIMMGFTSAVNIWHWKADVDAEFWRGQKPETAVYSDHYYPFEKEEVLPVTTPEIHSAVSDLLAERAGSLTTKEKQAVIGRGGWKDGRWSVVLQRSLGTGDPARDVQFASGRSRTASFAVWNGESGDRGARKSISEWVILDIESPSASEAAGANASSWLRFSILPSAHAESVEAAPETAQPRVITIHAKRFEYMPNKITLQRGERVTILLESLDVTHGLYLDAYGIQLKARPGMPAKATFVADKPGRFSFRCSETCGEFHPYMIGFLTVAPNTRFHIFIGGVLAAGAAALVWVIFARQTKKEQRGTVQDVQPDEFSG